MDIKHQKVSTIKALNRQFLAEGVVGVACTSVGCYEDVQKDMSKRQKGILETIASSLPPQEYVNTIELYSNGAMNVFLRSRATHYVVGYVRVR